MKIHTGDTVLIISGKDKGKTGTVLRVLPEANRVIVESINMRVRHIKKTSQAPGQRVKYEASLSVSNVMILDPKTKKPTRVGYKIDEKTGQKKRIARTSGEVIATVSQVKAAPKKTTPKTKGAKKTDKKEEASTEVAEGADASKMPTKQPFWKRAFSGNGTDAGTDGGVKGADTKSTVQTIRRTSNEG